STRFWVNPVSRTVCFSAVTSIVLTTNKVSRSFRWRVDTETPQCLDLFNPDIGVSKGNWLFHCQLGNDLHNVVLYHVTQGTRLVVVTGPLFDTQLFTQGNLDVVDVTVVPQGFDNSVTKAQCLDVLHHFLTQVVVDPEDLVFVKGLGQCVVQLLGGIEVATEWLFNYQPVEAVVGKEPLLLQVHGDGTKELGSHRHVEEAVAFRTELLIQL